MIDFEKVSLDFMIIGAARCGTSSLVKYLNEYEDVFIPVNVEPNFFFKEDEYEKGLEYYCNKYFSDANKKVIGEKSSSYLYGGEKTAKRIKSEFPDVKLVILLRNPISRVFSNYMFTVKNGIEVLDFNYVIKNEKERTKHYIDKWVNIKPYNYIGRSEYFSQMKAYLDNFDLNNIHIVVFEELISSPRESLSQLSEFLGIEYNDKIEFMKTNFTDNSITIDEDSYNYLYDELIGDVNKLSNLIGKDLAKIWNL
ncbi:sulfotransferase [Arcobacter sp. LA11]|uniref:sulfotransferase family protein n=1 Tax=Arcobacter sp. LA11 TaxID=1898176 RepID=UPI00093557AF|nr:sulfotransferase [Arcobacter sp. LA11]